MCSSAPCGAGSASTWNRSTCGRPSIRHSSLCASTYSASTGSQQRRQEVLLSGIEGASVVLLADWLFSRRAAFVGGLLWAGCLPLVAYTHFLWPETLFLFLFLSLLLPAVFLFNHAARARAATALDGAATGGGRSAPRTGRPDQGGGVAPAGAPERYSHRIQQRRSYRSSPHPGVQSCFSPW